MEKAEKQLATHEERLSRQEASEVQLKDAISRVEEGLRKDLEKHRQEMAQELDQLKETQTGLVQGMPYGEELEKHKQELAQEVNKLKEANAGNEKEIQMLHKAKENAEKIRRKSNLIFFKLPESANEDAGARSREDRSAIEKICREDLDIEPLEVVKALRLGHFKKNRDDNARPLKVICKSEEECKRVLSRLSVMRGEKNPKLEQVFITQDLPYEERQAARKLRVELKTRKNAGEGNLMIRRGQIVERNGRHSNGEVEGRPDTGHTAAPSPQPKSSQQSPATSRGTWGDP
jgi:hypothetical protein